MGAHIESLKLKAFKSVGAAWLEVPFQRGLNAVVGPNGCGKSSLLDALLFVSAAPFAAASLAALPCTDCSEVCEVRLTLRAQGGQLHTVAAALTPDGSRAYKVDGRARSGREVRDFLRSLGLCLDSPAAVIKQAAVTRLADANSAAHLAAVVAEASGLGRWNAEVAAASEELRRTRAALADVQGGLLTLEASVAADQRTLAAAERQQQLEHEAAEAAQQMVGLLRSAISICDTAAATAAGGAENAGAAATTAQMAVHAQQQRLEAAQADLLAAQREAQQGSGGGASGVLQQGVAAAEEEVRLLMEQQKQRRELEAQLAAAQTAASQAATAHAAATAELEAARQAQRQAAANADAAESAASAPALRSSLGSEEQRLMAAVAGCEQAVVAASAAVEEGSGRLEVLQAEAARLKAAAAAAASGGGSINAAALASLNAQVQQQRAQLEALQAAEQEAAAEVGTLSTRLARAAGGGGAGSESKDSAAWRPLHRCFTLRQPEDCKPWAQALQVLTGGQLGVVVADTLAAASQLLSSGSGGAGVRIWPLDTLAAADRTEEQRRVARRFPAGKVVLPLDLLAFEERHRPAMLRAFGSHVIAAADAVAEELSTRWGVASVTVDGRITSRGTLQGGWRGGSSGGNGAMELKMALDAAEQQLATVRKKAAAVQAALHDASQRLQQAAEQHAAAEAAASEAAAAERGAQVSKLQLAGQRSLLADSQAALVRQRADLAGVRQLLSSMAGAEADGASPAALVAALAEEQRRQAAAVVALEKRAAVAAAQLAAAAAEAAGAEDALALQGADCMEAWEQALSGLRAELAAAAAALADCQAALAAASLATAARQQDADAAAALVSAAEQRAAESAAEAAELADAVEQAAREREELQQQLAALLHELPELEGAPPAAVEADSSADAQSVAALRQAVGRLARRRSALREEDRRGGHARLPPAQQQRMREQQASLAAARGQAATLAKASERLQEGIAGSNAQVLAANEAVYAAIASTFAGLAAAVMPAYRVRLRKVGEAVHEGVQLEFAQRGGSEEGGEEGSGWRSGLDVLSGGQRTLVSLAFVVAASMTSTSAVLLMDEVDAALDESNQHLVARLFASLHGSAASACAQLLCVSHNSSFQQLCDHVVQLTRRPAGTALAAGSGGGKGGGAASGAAPAVRAKKARKG